MNNEICIIYIYGYGAASPSTQRMQIVDAP